MPTKFPKSNINVDGMIYITVNHSGYQEQDIKICLNKLNQSKSGVYCLRNKLDGRLYIGMARNLAIRRDRHFNDLMKGIHSSKILQADFDDYSSRFNCFTKDDFSELFEFEVIIYCYPSELTFWEKILIDNLHPYYNVKKKKEMTFSCDPDLDPDDKNDISFGLPRTGHIHIGDEND